MSKGKFVKNWEGVKALLASPEVAALMEQEGQRVAGAAGDGYAFRVHYTGRRQAVNIYPDTFAAKRDNLKNNTLLKAVQS